MFPEGPGLPLSNGVLKLDTSETGGNIEVGRILHGPKRWGGEAYFVPSDPDSTDPAGERIRY